MQKWLPKTMPKNVNIHKCSSIIKLWYRTDSISKRNKNIHNCLLSPDQKKNININREHFEEKNKTTEKVFIFLGPSINQAIKA